MFERHRGRRRLSRVTRSFWEVHSLQFKSARAPGIKSWRPYCLRRARGTSFGFRVLGSARESWSTVAWTEARPCQLKTSNSKLKTSAMPDFRAYCSPSAAEPSEITLSPEESHHLVAVNRARVGDTVVAFDGRGTEWIAELASDRKNAAVLKVRF